MKYFAKNILLLLLYQLWKTALSRSLSMHCKCKNVQPLVPWVTKVFVTCVRLQLQPKIFQKQNLERKNQNFWFMEKHLSYNFHIWKNAYHRGFIQFDKKFLIYGNCMIGSFGQPESRKGYKPTKIKSRNNWSSSWYLITLALNSSVNNQRASNVVPFQA